jgi:glucose-1-phosphate adenylyltransferase
LTIASLYVPVEMADRFGVLGIDIDYRVTSFVEKPKNPPQIPDKPGFSFVNMGIYIFNKDTIIEVLQTMENQKIKNHDFGHDVIPYMVKNGYKVYSYKFVDENKKDQPYWMDIGTIESYYEASMDLISVNPVFNLYDRDWPLRTMQLQFPPAKTISHEGERVGRLFNSLVCDGSIISGGLVERSILGPNVRINSYSYVADSILFNNVNVGRHARIRRAIIDKNVSVPEGFEIGYDLEKDRQRFKVTETGIVVIEKNYKF